MKRTLDIVAPGDAGAKRLRGGEVSRLFVGGLAYSTDWKSLKDHFMAIGDVEFASVLTKPDGSSKGCGMVNYINPADAQRAVQLLNESLLDGRHIMVKLDLNADFKKPPAPGAGGPSQASQLIQAVSKSFFHGGGGGGEGVHLPPDQISRVFVGNLSFSTTWQALKDHFKAAGTVEFASVLENPNKTSKGCGMVNFLSNEEARAAVSLLHESALDGRQITVKLDVDGKFKERPPPKSQMVEEKREEPFYTLPPEHISRVFVGNLAYNTNWQAMKDHFSQVGEIEFASVLLNPDRTSKGCGMVNFNSHEDAMRAVETLHNSMLDGRQITVKLDVDGHFKERPPPGARPRVFQKPKEPELLPALGAPPPGSAVAVQRVQEQLAGVLGGRTGRGQPQASAIDWLSLLGQVAQMPAASNIDWPNLINSIAATASRR